VACVMARPKPRPGPASQLTRRARAFRGSVFPTLHLLLHRRVGWNVYDSNPHGLAHKLITLDPDLARVEPKFIHSASLIASRVGGGTRVLLATPLTLRMSTRLAVLAKATLTCSLLRQHLITRA
jgi:hypothetical protein